MAKKKNALIKWMKQERITQRVLAEDTGINQSLISSYCNGGKVSDNSMMLFEHTKAITGMPNEVLNTIKNQHL